MRNALKTMMATMLEHLLRSLKWDLDKELSAHAQFKVETGIPMFFADPQLPLAAPHEGEHQQAAEVVPKKWCQNAAG